MTQTLTLTEANAQFDEVMNTEYSNYFEADAAVQAAFDAVYAAMDAEKNAADENTVEEFQVVTEWSRVDSYGNYRDFTRTRTYRATSVAEAMDMALADMPNSFDSLIDQYVL